MTEILLANDDDARRWDEYVEQHEDASPYHLTAWTNAVEAAYGHQVIRLIAEEEGKVVGVLASVVMKSPLGGSSFCSLPFCDVGGVLSDRDDIATLIGARLSEIAESEGASSIELRSRAKQRLTDSDDFSGKVSMILDLPATSDELFSGFKAKLRSQVRKAEKNGLTFRSGRDPELLDHFYTVLARNMRDLGSPVHSKQWFESIAGEFGDRLLVGIVYKDTVPVGAGILLFASRMAAIPWASTVAEYNRLAPNMLLYWHMLKSATDKGCEKFDFGRSSFGEGTYRFKKQWGAIPVALDWNIHGREADASQSYGDSGESRLRRIAEFAWKRLPVPFANAIGPRIRRHISL